MSLTHFLYPRLCSICGDIPVSKGPLCKRCLTESSLVSPLMMLEDDYYFHQKIALFDFNTIQAMVHRLKYEHCFYEVQGVGTLLMNHPDFRAFIETFDYLTWVPLHWYRALRRGYNQAKVIAQSLEAYKGQGRGLLLRQRYTTSQTTFNRVRRTQNIEDAFRCKKRINSLKGKRILLIDDVCTTGATARACAEALYAKNAQAVSLLTLAQA